MIGRSQSVKAPDILRQHAIGEFVAFAPPLVPNAADIVISSRLGPREFCRKQTADAKEARLDRERFAVGSQETEAAARRTSQLAIPYDLR